MIRCFKNCMQIAVAGGILAALGGLALTVLIAPLDNLAKNLALGAAVAFVAVNILLYFVRIYAMRQYNEIMALLYHDREPEAFLKRAEPLLEGGLDASQHANTTVHISNGWLAAGDPHKALALLEGLHVPESALEMRGLLSSNRATCCLQLGNIAEAKAAMNDTHSVIRQKKCKKEFADKARRTLAFQQLHVQVLEGDPSPREALEKDFAVSRSPLHKVTVAQLLMRAYRESGDRERFEEMRSYILENGKGLAAVEQARSATF